MVDVNDGETMIWKNVDGDWEARFFSDKRATPEHFAEVGEGLGSSIRAGQIYLVLDPDVMDDEDQIFGEYGYLIEVKQIEYGANVGKDESPEESNQMFLVYEEFHIDRDEPTSDPMSTWGHLSEKGAVVEMEEV